MDAEGNAGFEAGRWTAGLAALVRAAAHDAGFHLSGIASAEADPGDATRFEAWVESGRAGEMEYLKRRDASGALLRGTLQTAIPWARSVVVCALSYDSTQPLSIDPAPAGSGWIGRYAWSGARQPDGTLLPTDYHSEMLGRLRLVEGRLLERAACQTRCYVDTGPIVERDFAARAGIGWTGKNTCVINQQLGSWLLLGVIVASLELPVEAGPVMAPDRCGSCTRCIDACPTDALVAPREMDASRCIAYLTIEKKGAIKPDLREGMGRQVFGCDICQDVCPWNGRHRDRDRAGQPAAPPGMEPRPELVNPSLTWLAEMDSGEFKRRFKGSPLERTGRKRLLRNVAIAMGNSGCSDFVPRLESWSRGEDEVLAEAARWAIDRLRSAVQQE
jgi:epoxyqueuosine reductase